MREIVDSLPQAELNRRLLRRVLLTLGALDLAAVAVVVGVSRWGGSVGITAGLVGWILVVALASIVGARVALGFRLKPRRRHGGEAR